MFERLETVIPDPILGLMAAFRADPDPRKVDLGVGVYRDDRGETPVLNAVREAERAVLAHQTTKTYVAASGNAAFNEAIERLVLGDQHEARVTARVRTVQAPGGCGALRLGAELIRAAAPDSVVHVSTPTWASAKAWRRTHSRCACSAPSFPRCCARCPARRTSDSIASAPARCTSSTRRRRPRTPLSVSWCASRAASGRCPRITAPRSCTRSSPRRRCAPRGGWSSTPCASASGACARRR